MKRAGGFRGYWSAYTRLLLESARPVDSHSVSTPPPGQYTARVGEVEHGWNFLRVEFVSGYRRIWTHLSAGSALLGQACRAVGAPEPAPGDFGRLAARVRDAEVVVDVRRVGDAEVLVCADRTWLVKVGEEMRPFENPREVDAWLSENGLVRAAPTVVGIRSVSRAAPARRSHTPCSDRSRPSGRGSRTSTHATLY